MFFISSRCGLPMCCKECETNGYHPLECKVFAKASFRFIQSDFDDENCLYQSILPLRCLMLKESNPKKWGILEAMESHCEMRNGTELWEIEQVQYLLLNNIHRLLDYLS